MNNLIVLILPKRLFEPTAIEATRLASKELENDTFVKKIGQQRPDHFYASV